MSSLPVPHFVLHATITNRFPRFEGRGIAKHNCLADTQIWRHGINALCASNCSESAPTHICCPAHLVSDMQKLSGGELRSDLQVPFAAISGRLAQTVRPRFAIGQARSILVKTYASTHVGPTAGVSERQAALNAHYVFETLISNIEYSAD